MERRDRLVSAVIPTLGRPELVLRAIGSVLAQTHAPVEAVVVIDGPDDATRAALAALADPRIRVVALETRQGPAAARNAGVRAAAGAFVALLDDDDEWTPEKLERQLAMLDRSGLAAQSVILSSRIIARVGAESFVWPRRLYQEGDDLSEYLILRRFGDRPGVVCSGTLVFARSLALAHPFPDDDDHEDWSWLLERVSGDGIDLLMCPDPLFVYHLQPGVLSRSKRALWRTTLAWARRYRRLLTPRSFAALLASKGSMKAKRQNDWPGLVRLGWSMAREGRPTLFDWATLAGTALLPLRLTERYRSKSFGTGCAVGAAPPGLPPEPERRAVAMTSPTGFARRASGPTIP